MNNSQPEKWIHEQALEKLQVFQKSLDEKSELVWTDIKLTHQVRQTLKKIEDILNTFPWWRAQERVLTFRVWIENNQNIPDRVRKKVITLLNPLTNKYYSWT